MVLCSCPYKGPELVQIRTQLAYIKLTFKGINNEVISVQTTFLKSKFNLEVVGENKKLLNIY